jgi:hypothetical protein
MTRDERDALVRCERTGEHQLIHERRVENVTFQTCPCGAIAITVDGIAVETTEQFLTLVGGEEAAARIGAQLRGEPV